MGWATKKKKTKNTGLMFVLDWKSRFPIRLPGYVGIAFRQLAGKSWLGSEHWLQRSMVLIGICLKKLSTGKRCKTLIWECQKIAEKSSEIQESHEIWILKKCTDQRRGDFDRPLLNLDRELYDEVSSTLSVDVNYWQWSRLHAEIIYICWSQLRSLYLLHNSGGAPWNNLTGSRDALIPCEGENDCGNNCSILFEDRLPLYNIRVARSRQ